jgi:hypothetical protein
MTSNRLLRAEFNVGHLMAKEITTAVLCMYSLIKGTFDYVLQKPCYNIIILGLDNAGKTVTINYHHEEASKHIRLC